MLDFGHLPTPTGNSDVQLFTCPSTVNQLQWHTWLKPRGKTMMHAILASGGGAGGNGATGVAASARVGGGSGGSSGLTRLTIPLAFVPDALYVQVGRGGDSIIGNPLLSYIAAKYSAATPGTVNPNNIFAVSGAAAPTNGTIAGAAGAGGTIATIAAMPLAHMGHFDFIAGTNGASGGAAAGAVGGAAAQPTATPFWGASGGAGTTSADFAGGAFTANADSLFSEMRPATAAAGSNHGSGGFTLWTPFISFGGGGGGSSNAGVGGNGGNGGLGCGGGGGGGGTTGGTGGAGGSGFVLIICW